MRGCPDHGDHHMVRGAPGLMGLPCDPGAQQDGSGPDGLRPVTRVTHLRGLHVYRDPTRGRPDNLSDLLVQVVQVIGAEVTMGRRLGAEDVREGGQGGGGAPDQAGQLPPGQVNTLTHLLTRPRPHLTLMAGQATDRAPGVAAVCKMSSLGSLFHFKVITYEDILSTHQLGNNAIIMIINR